MKNKHVQKLKIQLLKLRAEAYPPEEYELLYTAILQNAITEAEKRGLKLKDK